MHMYMVNTAAIPLTFSSRTHCIMILSLMSSFAIQFQEAMQTLYYGHGEPGMRRKQKNSPEYKTDFIVVGPINHRAYIAAGKTERVYLHGMHAS